MVLESVWAAGLAYHPDAAALANAESVSAAAFSEEWATDADDDAKAAATNLADRTSQLRTKPRR